MVNLLRVDAERLVVRHRQSFLEEICQGVRLQNKISSLFVISSIFFAISGTIFGVFNTWAQVLPGAIFSSC
ncbi:hypothetical protein [Nostoc sp.]|uniref:hypothetical protein n=1 Tax=Nostoc sp. TaxID=1180 RepID=UPI002FF5DD01